MLECNLKKAKRIVNPKLLVKLIGTLEQNMKFFNQN